MANSFRVYLPSNASMNVFPHNKPADYQVQLNPPLQLEGDWEVGVENVCYDSAIENVNETEDIKLNLHTYEEASVNDEYSFPYKLTKDGKWNYDWIQLEYHPPFDDPNHPVNIRRTLDSGNQRFLRKFQKIYEFVVSFGTPLVKDPKEFRFNAFSDSFSLRLYKPLVEYLGFGPLEHFTRYLGSNIARDADRSKIKETDLKIKIFDESVVECEERILFKKQGEKAPSVTNFVKQWNETIGKKYGEKASTKSGRFIIMKENDKLTLRFSYNLGRTISHRPPMIGSGTFSGRYRFRPRPTTKESEWWVDVYGDRIKKRQTHYQEYKTTITISPRQYPTVDALIQAMNPQLKRSLTQLLQSKYDVKMHSISFSINNQKTVLSLGKNIKCYLSENLMKLFGFSQSSFQDSRTISMEAPMTLDKREQHLYIQSDIISPILVGEGKEYILRDFIHDRDKTYGIVEKLFEPILYHPVAKQTIPIIALKITNGLRECIHLKDTKSLITLIFRKAK